MMSFSRFDEPLDVEDINEFHAARLLLLLLICGEGERKSIKGRTKLAKLDFFVRYPRYLEIAVNRRREAGHDLPNYTAGAEGVEASMIRYRYGPWDHRYYNLVAMLRARGLIAVRGGVETYTMTATGRSLAQQLASLDAFAPVVERCNLAAQAFAGMNGTELKQFIYATFDRDIVALSSGSIIDSPSMTGGGI